MRFAVTEIDILNSKAGVGLKVGNKTIGCARITAIDMEEGTTLRDLALKGLNLGYKLVKPETPNAEGDMVLVEELKASNNYVLFIQDGEDTLVVHSTEDITDAFGLSKDDAENMDKYLSLLADQRNLHMERYTDINDESECIFFTNQVEREMVESILDDDGNKATGMFCSILNNPDLRSELSTHNFIKIFVMSVVQAGQDRYNKVNRDDIITGLAEKFSTISYWKDGELCAPSVKDVRDYMDQMCEQIRIK